MAVSPISSVSFRGNYNQVNFEGKKDKREQYHTSSFTNTLKSIPLAVAIAMSPLVTQAQAPQEKNVLEVPVDTRGIEPSNRNDYCAVRFISNDGNDENVEVVRLVYSSPYRGRLKGYEGRVECKYTNTLDVNTLELRNVTNKSGTETWQEYYAWGPAKITRSMVKLPDGTWTGKAEIRRVDELKVQISNEVYDYLKEIMGNGAEYKSTNKIDNGSSGLTF